jgi:PAS domain-containing protein
MADHDSPADPKPTEAGSESTETDLDAEALVAALVDGDVLAVDTGSDTVTTTAAFEDTRAIYHDSYESVPEDVFHEAVADAFGFASAERAAERVEALGVTRAEFVAYLAIDSELDGSQSPATLARMARVVDGVGPGTPVPEDIPELDDESYRAFVEANERAIITVWKHHCDPCEAMKEELDAILDAIPDGVAIGGLDGEQCEEFRRAHGIDAAPAIVLFENEEFREGFTGRATPDRVAAACEEVYDS